MTRTRIWPVAAACAGANAAVHLYLAPVHLTEKPYIGVLFIIGSALLLAAVGGLVWSRTRVAAWWLGGAVSVGMCAGYIASRTIGLPSGYHETWNDPFGTACLILEAIYLAAFVAAGHVEAHARWSPQRP